jgi:hypothetical protein
VGSGIDVLNAQVRMPDRASAYPLQSSAGKMEMKMRIQLDGLSRDGENTDVGTSQMPPSVQKTPSPEVYPLHDA